MSLGVLSLGLSGCAAGTDSVTIKPYAPTDGNQAQSGTIKVRNVLIVEQADGTGELLATFVNSGLENDAVTSIVVNNAPVVLSASPLTLEPNKAVIFGGESANASGRIAAVGAKAGQLVPVTISFEKAAPVSMTILIRQATLEFTPTTTPTPTTPTTP